MAEQDDMPPKKGFTGFWNKMEAKDERQDARTDNAWKEALDGQKSTNRLQWVVILFLVAVVVVMAGREIGFDFMGMGFSGGGGDGKEEIEKGDRP